jgi:ATP-dependent RNA helicase RhlE
LPLVAADDVHHVGRMGRAGVPGHAVSLVTADEKSLLLEIQNLVSTPLEPTIVEGFEVSSGRAHSGQPRENRGKQKRREFVPDWQRRRQSGRTGAADFTRRTQDVARLGSRTLSAR